MTKPDNFSERAQLAHAADLLDSLAATFRSLERSRGRHAAARDLAETFGPKVVRDDAELHRVLRALGRGLVLADHSERLAELAACATEC